MYGRCWHGLLSRTPAFEFDTYGRLSIWRAVQANASASIHVARPHSMSDNHEQTCRSAIHGFEQAATSDGTCCMLQPYHFPRHGCLIGPRHPVSAQHRVTLPQLTFSSDGLFGHSTLPVLSVSISPVSLSVLLQDMASNAASPASPHGDALSRLAEALSSKARVLFPSDPAYHTVRLSWNEELNRALPSVIIEVACTADVVCALSFARDTSQQFTLSCGRHSRWSCRDGQLMISLAGMRQVAVHAARGLVELQGGALVADVDRECAPYHLYAVTATTGDVGCGGLILGGGVGYLTRGLGACIDQLLSLELVTHEGAVLQVSETEHAELFWGMRGAGFNFGIVTRFTLRLHRVGHVIRSLTDADTAIESQHGLPHQHKLEHRVLSGSLLYPLSMTNSLLSKLDCSYIQPGRKGRGPYADRDLLLSVIVAKSRSGPACMVSFTHVGDVYRGLAAMHTLIHELGTPLTNTVRTGTQAAAMIVTATFQPALTHLSMV